MTSQIVGRLGPLEYVLNTPSHHRVHHGTVSHLSLSGCLLFCWCVCLFVSLTLSPLCLSVCLFVILVFLSLCLSLLCVCLSLCLCLSVSVSLCLSVSVCLSVCLFVCLSVCLSACLSVCLSFSLFLFISLSLSCSFSLVLYFSLSRALSLTLFFPPLSVPFCLAQCLCLSFTITFILSLTHILLLSFTVHVWHLTFSCSLLLKVYLLEEIVICDLCLASFDISSLNVHVILARCSVIFFFFLQEEIGTALTRTTVSS